MASFVNNIGRGPMTSTEIFSHGDQAIGIRFNSAVFFFQILIFCWHNWQPLMYLSTSFLNPSQEYVFSKSLIIHLTPGCPAKGSLWYCWRSISLSVVDSTTVERIAQNHLSGKTISSSLSPIFSDFPSFLERASAQTFFFPSKWWMVKLNSASSVIHLAWCRLIFWGFRKVLRFLWSVHISKVGRPKRYCRHFHNIFIITRSSQSSVW